MPEVCVTKMSEQDLLASLSLLEIDSVEKDCNQVRDAKGCPHCQNLDIAEESESLN